MKLTKSQLDTLTSFIVDEIQDKINIYKESKEGQLAFKKYLDKYKDIMPEIHQIETLDKDIAKLSIKRSNLMTSVTRKVREKDSKASVPYTNEALMNICNYEFKQELRKTFPTVEQIRTTVVLKTLENSGDLLTKLKEEFGI